MRPDQRSLQGFTLIEMVIVMVLIAIMGAALTPVISNSLTAYSTVTNNVAVLDKLRYATERLAREIRETKHDGTAFLITTPVNAPNSNITFTRTYFDASGAESAPTVVTVVGNTGADVTLAYSTYPRIGAQILTDGLGTLTFSYFDKNGCDGISRTTPCTGTEVITSSNVRSVQIDLTLGNNYPQRTRVELKRFAGSS